MAQLVDVLAAEGPAQAQRITLQPSALSLAVHPGAQPLSVLVTDISSTTVDIQMDHVQTPSKIQELIDNDHPMPPGLPDPVEPDPSLLDENPLTPLRDEEIIDLNCSRELLPDQVDGKPAQAPAQEDTTAPLLPQPEQK